MKLLQKPQGNDLYAILPGCHAVRPWWNLKLARLREEPGLYVLSASSEGRESETLDRPVPIILGYQFHNLNRLLNGVIQLLPRRVVFEQIGVGPV